MSLNNTGVQTEFTDSELIERETAGITRLPDFEEQILKEQEAILQMEYAYGYANRLCYAKRRRVGSVIYKNRKPISCGYNGTPSGEPNECEYEDENGNLVTKLNVIHAEANALDKLVLEGNHTGAKNSALFATTAPCMGCALRIHNSGISTVYFTELYRGVEGLEHLIKHGVSVKHIDLNSETITEIYISDKEQNFDLKIEGIKTCRQMLNNYEDGKYHKVFHKVIV